MANAPSTGVAPLTRAKLASFLPDHEAVRHFEALTDATSTTLPEAIGAAVDSAASAEIAASDASFSAAAARALADEVTTLQRLVSDQDVAISSMQRQLDEMRAFIGV